MENKEDTRRESQVSTMRLAKLIALGPTCVALYMLYVLHTKLQNSNPIQIDNNSCMNTFGWGKTTFYKAKKELIRCELISPVIKKDNNNKITGHFIQIN